MNPLLPALLGLAAAVFGPMGAYLVIRRQTSGSVRKSDAKTIFDASEELRHDLVAQLEAQQIKIVGLEAKVDRMSTKIDALLEESASLRKQLAEGRP